MIRCPQCGADLPVREQELHPSCPFCGTAFRLQGPLAARHLYLPAPPEPRDLLRAVRDHLARRAPAPSGVPTGLPEPDLQTYYLPFHLLGDGSSRAAFETHVPELRRFRLPGCDLKLFDPSGIRPGEILVPPTDAGEKDATAARLAHYPFSRIGFRLREEEFVLWVDAGRGRVVADNLGALPESPRRVGPVLAAASLAYFGAMLLLPFPWSLGAAAAATPLLYRWGIATIRGAA